jgi:mannose-6-phosphate isomerase-like protein (cupin superfamily)
MTRETILRPDEKREYYSDERCFILEMSNDAGDPDASIARARVESGVTTRRHRLRGTEERYVILHGTGSVHIGSNLVTTVGPGDVVRIPAGVSQSITNTGSDALVFLCICTPRFEPSNYESLE